MVVWLLVFLMTTVGFTVWYKNNIKMVQNELPNTGLACYGIKNVKNLPGNVLLGTSPDTRGVARIFKGGSHRAKTRLFTRFLCHFYHLL